MLLMAWHGFGASAAGDVEAKVRIAVQANDPAAQVSSVDGSPVSGLYSTTIDGVSGYVSADGRYFIVGDMLDLTSRTNVTEEKRKKTRRELLKKIGPGEAIVFGPEKPKYTITVFTDADCPYCRKLHEEMGELEKKGVEVRYVAFPRSGPGTKTWKTMTAVWCAEDRREALTRVTQGEMVKEEKKKCDRSKGHKARRWVVERTLAWLCKCRAILVRYDKKDENFLGLVQLACALLWYRRLDRLGRSDSK